MRLDLLALRLCLIIESLEHFRVLAGVDGEHPAVQKWAIFLSDCLVLVLGVDVLEDLFGVERVAIAIIALDPQSRCEVVLIIGNIHAVLAVILLSLLQTLLPCDLHKAPLVAALALHDLLLGQLTDPHQRSGRRSQILLLVG